MSQTILHLCSYYTGQRLYANLFRKLNKFDLKQHIYIPIRSAKEAGLHQITDLQNLHYCYDDILRSHHRIIYYLKLHTIRKNVEANVKVQDINIIHAHSLFSDGGPAFRLKTLYNKPYIVAVRSTDVNVFLKYLPHLRPLALKILTNSEAVVFINPDLKKKLYNIYKDASLLKRFEKKSICLPNGIDDYWLSNVGEQKVFSGKNLSLLYVGTFIRRKNLPLVIAAAKILMKKYNVSLTVVGGGEHMGEGNKSIIRSIANGRRAGLKISVLGRLDSKSRLQEIYKTADVFVMPSRNETFGLVYIEAMTQGTPVVYTKGEGISGYFEQSKVGAGVEKFTPQEVASKITEILQNYKEISLNCIAAVGDYSWDKIADSYLNLYRSI